MFLTENKLQARIHELSALRYRDRKTLSVFLACEDRREDINPTVPGAEANWQPMHINETWTGRDLYLWLRTDAEIPLSWENKRIVGLFDFGDTGAAITPALNPFSTGKASLFKASIPIIRKYSFLLRRQAIQLSCSSAYGPVLKEADNRVIRRIPSNRRSCAGWMRKWTILCSPGRPFSKP